MVGKKKGVSGQKDSGQTEPSEESKENRERDRDFSRRRGGPPRRGRGASRGRECMQPPFLPPSHLGVPSTLLPSVLGERSWGGNSLSCGSLVVLPCVRCILGRCSRLRGHGALGPPHSHHVQLSRSGLVVLMWSLCCFVFQFGARRTGWMVGRVEALLEEARREGDGDVAGAEVRAGL